MRQKIGHRCINPWKGASARLGFTLPEALIASTLFVLLVGGVIEANLFGLRMSQFTQTKLKKSDAGRQLLGRLCDDIRTCKSTYIGSVSNGMFVALLDGVPQIGNAICVYPTTNAANYIVYYLKHSDQSFHRNLSSTGADTLLAQQVTNSAIFCAQDCLGNILTNSQNNRVIHFDLQFLTPQPLLPSSDYYELQASVTRRTVE